jgi:hypothetical protein
MKETMFDGGIFRELELQTVSGTGYGYAVELCRFLDYREKEISSSDFFSRYMKRVITIDFIEDREGRYAIIECRVGR